MAFRRPPNLRDLLVKADVSTKNTKHQHVETTTMATTDKSKPVPPEKDLIQTSITSFFKRDAQATASNSNPSCDTSSQNRDVAKPKTMAAKKRNFCSNPKCRTCPLIDKSGHIECHLTGEMFNCKENITCQSSNLVYGITCKRCGKQYVGQTKRPLYQRVQEHLRSIKKMNAPSESNTKPQPVGLHFGAPDHLGIRDVKVQVLDFIHFHPDSNKAKEVRLRVEKKWIHRLRCPAPHGMNIFD
jgi:hypothetical protein